MMRDSNYAINLNLFYLLGILWVGIVLYINYKRTKRDITRAKVYNYPGDGI